MRRIAPLALLGLTALSASAQTAPAAPAQATSAAGPSAPAAAPSSAPAPTSAAPQTVVTPGGDSQMSAEPTFVLGNASLNNRAVKVTLYGFVEADSIFDSTQSFTELQGNGSIAKIGSEAGDNGRAQFGARNSRFGIKVDSPETASGIKATGNLEMDFLGFNSISAVATTPAVNGTTEAGIYASPTFRIRHGFVKLATPYIDVVFGQTWNPLGGAALFIPATVDLQGAPAEIYQRTAQLRLGKTLKFGDFKGELEVAAIRPYQRDSMTPDFGGFLRLAWDGWKGYKASGPTGGDDSGVQLAFSALTRKFRALAAVPTGTSDYQTATGTAFALDAIIPIIPGSKLDKNNVLTLVGEISTGSGYNDLFQSWGAGVSSIGTPSGVPTGKTYASGANLDPGVAGFNTVTGKLDTIDAKSMLVSLQYFLPINNGSVYVSAVYGTLQSDNATNFTTAASAITDVRWFNADILWDVTSAVRTGLSWGKTRQRFGDNSVPCTNDRVQLSAWYIF